MQEIQNANISVSGHDSTKKLNPGSLNLCSQFLRWPVLKETALRKPQERAVLGDNKFIFSYNTYSVIFTD